MSVPNARDTFQRNARDARRPHEPTSALARQRSSRLALPNTDAIIGAVSLPVFVF